MLGIRDDPGAATVNLSDLATRSGSGEAMSAAERLMNAGEPGIDPTHRQVTADVTIAPPVPEAGRRFSPRRIAAIALVAGAAESALGFLAGEWARDLFQPRLFEVPRWEAVWMEPTAQSRHAALVKNAALTNGILASAAALAMGLAGGLAARTPGRGLVVGLGAQAVGLVTGALAALALIAVLHPAAPPATPRSRQTCGCPSWYVPASGGRRAQSPGGRSRSAWRAAHACSASSGPQPWGRCSPQSSSC